MSAKRFGLRQPSGALGGGEESARGQAQSKTLAREGSGWTGRRQKMSPSQGTISNLLRLGVDVRCVRKLDGPPCEKWDCPRKVCKKLPLWSRPQHEILEVLRLAREKYVQALKEVHPDKPGGNTRAATNLIAIWTRVESAFEKRGYTLH